jgi:predicted nucleic acid-binding protein
VALDLLGRAQQGHFQLFAPNFLLIEVASAIRRMIFEKVLSNEEGDVALSNLTLLGLETVPLDVPLVRRALSWAGKLGQVRAYDACYLALPEREGATLWTADRRLAARTKQIGASWVLSLEEIEL